MTFPKLQIVVMAKPALPGRVKTRLIGRFTPLHAAKIHRAMLRCVLERLSTHLAEPNNADKILAINQPPDQPPTTLPLPAAANSWRQIPQGQGDLGQRMLNVTNTTGKGPIVFFGADTPDVPPDALRQIPTNPPPDHAALGPTPDGGYWCLAAQNLKPCLLQHIDWGTPAVYHQTLDAAEQHGIHVAPLPLWHDIDMPDDLNALQSRLADADEPALLRLRIELNKISKGSEI